MTEKNQLKISIGSFDLVKGIALLIIVYGHMTSYIDVEQMGVIGQAIGYTKPFFLGIIPMFFMISGYYFKEKNFKVVLKKSAQGLLIPYLWVGSIIAILFPVIHFIMFRWWPGAINETIRYILAFALGTSKPGLEIFGYSLYACNVSWFFLALFLTHNLLNTILKVKNEKIQLLLVGCCMVFGYICSIYRVWYFCIPQGFIATGYFFVGYKIKKNKWLLKRPSNVVIFILLVGAIYEILFGNFSLAYNEFENGFADIFGAGCLGMFFLYASVRTQCIVGIISDMIRLIGRYSYWIICIHDIETTCIPWYVLHEKFSENPLVGIILEIVFKILIISWGCIVLEKISKYKYRRKGFNK